MILTTLWESAKKRVIWNKSLNIYNNGEGNNYSELMKVFKENSITAFMASTKMFQFIIGKGFGVDLDKIKVGKSDLIEFAQDVARNITDERGVFVLVQFNALLEINSMEVLPFKNCRLGKRDDKKYHGKILVHECWESNPKEKEVQVFDVYNPTKDVLESQIIKAKGIENFKGQVFYYNMDREYIYPLSRIHPVYKECHNEELASTYKNRTLEFGFFGKTIVITRPLVGKNTHLNKTPEGILNYKKEQTERENFKDAIESFTGAQKVGGALHMEVDFAGDDISKAIHIQQVESKIDDKLFSYTESSAMSKILMAYNNLPEALIKGSDNSIFGMGGGTLKEMKLSYQQNVEAEQDAVEKICNELFSKTEEGKRSKSILKINKLISDGTELDGTKTPAESNAEAQAILRGSVGGVTALLAVQASVAAGTTDYESGVNILKEIYGFDDITARAILGEIKPIEEPKT